VCRACPGVSPAVSGEGYSTATNPRWEIWRTDGTGGSFGRRFQPTKMGEQSKIDRASSSTVTSTCGVAADASAGGAVAHEAESNSGFVSEAQRRGRRRWQFFYFYFFYFYFLQKYIFVFEIYKNIPGRPTVWSPRCRTAGAYL